MQLPNVASNLQWTAISNINGQYADSTGKVTLTISNASSNWGLITGTLSNQVDLQNALNLKLNTGANTSLSGTGNRILFASTNGTLSYDSRLSFITSTRELMIGTTANTGRLNVASNIFQLAVQDNITSGQASIVFNNGQEDALSFKDKSGNVYMTFRTLSGDTSVILKQREIYDESVFYPVTKRQASIVSEGAGVEVKAKDSLGNNIGVQFTTDTMVGVIEATLLLKNLTASQVIAAKVKAVVKRVAGNITVVSFIEILSNHTSLTGFQAGVKQSGNNLLFFYFTPDAADSTAYTGAFTEIKYSIN